DGLQPGTGGNDKLTGGANSTNTLYGDVDALVGSNGGNDTLTGGANSTNTLYGDGGTAHGNFAGGDAGLIGGAGGVNFLYGDFKNSFDSGPDRTGGDDRLVSAASTTDHMWGDVQIGSVVTGGHDTFAFRSNNGNDFVYDFHHGEDIIELGGFSKNLAKTGKNGTGADKAADKAFATLNIEKVDTNGDTVADSSVIHFNGSNSVTVYGITDLGPADFSFVV